MTWEALLKWAADLPGVEQGICYRTPALYVRKRILARLREDNETVAIKIDFLDRDVLLEADPVAFFLTDHYRPYPMDRHPSPLRDRNQDAAAQQEDEVTYLLVEKVVRHPLIADGRRAGAGSGGMLRGKAT